MLNFPAHSHCRSLTSLVQSKSASLAESGHIRRIADGQLVYEMGEATDHIYLVMNGKIRTSILSVGGRELVLGDHGPGDLFGELCFCDVRQRQEQAVALSASELVRLDVEHLINSVTGHSKELLGLLEFFCHRMGEMQQRLSEFAFASVRARLGLLLLRLSEDGAPAPGGGLLCRERPTHEEIAARVATTREQVSAILAQFRDQKLIEYRRGGPITVFPERLGQFLETT